MNELNRVHGVRASWNKQRAVLSGRRRREHEQEACVMVLVRALRRSRGRLRSAGRVHAGAALLAGQRHRSTLWSATYTKGLKHMGHHYGNGLDGPAGVFLILVIVAFVCVVIFY